MIFYFVLLLLLVFKKKYFVALLKHNSLAFNHSTTGLSVKT